MKNRLVHPLWTHLPAIAAIIAFIVYLIATGSLPAVAPLHFSFSGEPNSYGSPWLALGLTIGLSVFFILLSVFLDELWARQEKAKAFNWLSLLDDIVVGTLVGTNLGYLEFLDKGTGAFSLPWSYLVVFAVGATILAIILEKFRPYHHQQEQLVTKEDKTFKDSLEQHLRDDSPFIYWDYQNPFYVSLLTVFLPMILLVAAVFTLLSEPWAALLLGVVGILLIIPNGGQRTMVTRENITVRWGILGFKALRLKAAEIQDAEIHDFAPLRDFGGYGIRFNREMKAYFMRGTRGVKLTTINGKTYLIGSDFPDHLLSVLQGLVKDKN
jgi:hypothetical protein